MKIETLKSLISREITDLDTLLNDEMAENISINQLNIAINRAQNLMDELELLKSLVEEFPTKNITKTVEVTLETKKEEQSISNKEILPKEAKPEKRTTEPQITEQTLVEQEEVVTTTSTQQKEENEVATKLEKFNVEEKQQRKIEQEPTAEIKSIGENYKTEKSLNDIIAEKRTSISETIIKDTASIRMSIPLNDKIKFTRELFEGNNQLFSTTIDYLDNCTNIENAVDYLKNNFTWKKNEISDDFLQLVKRKFNN